MRKREHVNKTGGNFSRALLSRLRHYLRAWNRLLRFRLVDGSLQTVRRYRHFLIPTPHLHEHKNKHICMFVFPHYEKTEKAFLHHFYCHHRTLVFHYTFNRLKVIIATLRNYDDDGNGNVRKAVRLLSKTTTLLVHDAFLYISWPSLHKYNVKYV